MEVKILMVYFNKKIEGKCIDCEFFRVPNNRIGTNIGYCHFMLSFPLEMYFDSNCKGFSKRLFVYPPTDGVAEGNPVPAQEDTWESMAEKYSKPTWGNKPR